MEFLLIENGLQPPMNELFIGVITALPGSGTASWDSDDFVPKLPASFGIML
ncbi:hypothetical protein [Rhizobium leguminosarum]|uniref:hypothetical protein n=1 Tax=Rhizobium leguminosarum TaxID=384 RepID=UPI0013F16FF0|nr:hypothetical protein [Rhizobium leguminosarum]